jgi:uncharacterized protein with ParB-like and HNH nuclease domain
MANQLIHSDILTIQEIFSDFYDVPAYQRDYVWQDEHIEQLLEDVKRAIDEQRDNYFLGTIVVNRSVQNNYFDLIDGQQRLTTITLVFCAFKHYLQKKQIMPYAVIENILLGNTSITEIKMRLRLFPQYKESRDLIEFLASDKGLQVDNIVLNSMFDVQEQSIFNNLLRGYRTISKWLDDSYQSPEELRAFLVYFVSKVMFIRIQAINVSEAMRLFETINERGVRLDAVSLLKNMMFMNTPEAEYLDLQDGWNKMVRTVQHGRVQESAIRFIRYVVMAEYLEEGDPLIREDNLYAWFNHNTTRTKHDRAPRKFIKLLQDRAEQYIAIRNGKTTNKITCDGALNITVLSSSIRQHIPCMLAAYHLNDQIQQQIARKLENTLFILVFTSFSPSVFEKKITTITHALRKARTIDDVSAINKYLHDTFIQARQPEFMNRIRNFSATRIRTNIMRYMLAKLTRKMMRDEKTPLNDYLDKIDYCNILPLDVPANLDEAQAQEYMAVVQSIGNYVLMERLLAVKVRNGTMTFVEALSRTNQLYLLRLNQKAAQNEIMHAVPERWDVASVKARRDFMIELAEKEWLDL